VAQVEHLDVGGVHDLRVDGDALHRAAPIRLDGAEPAAGSFPVETVEQMASIVLEADARHLFTDVWTSAGVVGGLLAFGLVGIFVGPVLLAVTYTLLQAWVDGAPDQAGAD